MSANEKQVGGEHYKSKIQHWDYVVANDLDYFQAQITKYVTRWKKKNGFQDLLKAQHFLEKYIELEGQKQKVENDYQKQFSAKMQRDAMTGIPDHLREVVSHNTFRPVDLDHEDSTISPMLRNFWGGEEPRSQGYVNQDGPDV